MGNVAGDLGAAPHPAQRRPRHRKGGVGNPARGGRGLAGGRQGHARRMVGSAHRSPERDRRLHRRQGGPRISLRQALCRQRAHPRRRPLHGREPGTAPDTGGGRERRALLRPRRQETRLRRGGELHRDDLGEFTDRRRAAGAQGGPHRIHLARALARPLCLRRGALCGGRRREWRHAPRRRLHRP